MKKLYVILRENMFDAIVKNQIPEGALLESGSLWCTVAFTDAERERYTFSISAVS